MWSLRPIWSETCLEKRKKKYCLPVPVTVLDIGYSSEQEKVPALVELIIQ